MNASRLRLLIVAIILVHLAVNLSLPWLLWLMDEGGAPSIDDWQMYGIYFLIGISISQLNLIALWAVFAQGSIMLRLPWACLLAVLMWTSFVVVNRLLWPEAGVQELVTLGMYIGLSIPILMLPFWLARWGLGRRLCLSQEAQPDTSKHLPLRDFLIGIGLLCTALGLARFALQPEGITGVRVDSDTFVMLPILLVTNLTIVVPCVWTVFAILRRWWAWLLLLTLWIGLITATETVVMWLIGDDFPAELWGLVFSCNLAQGLSIVLTLATLRWAGFRFVKLAGYSNDTPAGTVEVPAPTGNNQDHIAIPPNLSESIPP